MLLNSFYHVIEKSATQVGAVTTLSARLRLNKSHAIFQGHFPGRPIVPGVCMIQMTKELLESEVGSPLFFTEGSNIKFLSVIDPEINNELISEIIYTAGAAGYPVDSKLYLGETTFFKIKGTFSASL